MNLEDVLDPEYGLQQDDWSSTNPKFGKEGQIEVIGWSGRHHNSSKWYIVKCGVCGKDPELNGEGYFRAFKNNLLKPSIPCGCSPRNKLSREQYIIIAQRLCPSNVVISDYIGPKSNTVYFKAECTSCRHDKELYPNGWEVSLSNLRKGQGISCGCSVSPKYSKDQWAVICKRVASERGLAFIGLGEWSGNNKTPVHLVCNCKDKVPFSVSSVDSFVNSGAGKFCENCYKKQSSKVMSELRKDKDYLENLLNSVTKPDEDIIKAFFLTGGFHPETKFWRDSSDSRYWYMFCPDCKVTARGHNCSLRDGGRPCECKAQRQKEAYINLIKDGENFIGLKFGIANISKNRLKDQKARSVYHIENYAIYSFTNTERCKKAEKECKKSLSCGVFSKQEIPDGYTETTYLYNLEKVIEIYEKYGGTRIN